MKQRDKQDRVSRLIAAAIIASGLGALMYWAFVGFNPEGNPWKAVAGYLLLAHLASDWKADKYDDKG